MARKMQVTGIESALRMLGNVENGAEKAAAAGLYAGAGVMADSIKAAAGSIQTAPFEYARPGQKRLPSPEEKALIMSAASGIAKFRKNGSEVQTSVGFDKAGYGDLAGKTVPIPLIANAINSGTSFMTKEPFFRRAVTGTKARAAEAIKKAAENAVRELTKEA